MRSVKINTYSMKLQLSEYCMPYNTYIGLGYFQLKKTKWQSLLWD